MEEYIAPWCYVTNPNEDYESDYFLDKKLINL